MKKDFHICLNLNMDFQTKITISGIATPSRSNISPRKNWKRTPDCHHGEIGGFYLKDLDQNLLPGNKQTNATQLHIRRSFLSGNKQKKKKNNTRTGNLYKWTDRQDKDKAKSTFGANNVV